MEVFFFGRCPFLESISYLNVVSIEWILSMAVLLNFVAQISCLPVL